MDYSQRLDDERQAARRLLARVRSGGVTHARDVAVVAAVDQAERALADAVVALGRAARAAERLAPCCRSAHACPVH
jgi:hypothetical protein